MKIHRFFLQQELSSGPFVVQDPTLIHQWHKVLRFEAGEPLIVFNGVQEWRSHLEKINNSEATVVCDELLRTYTPKKHLRILAVAIPKGDAFDWLVEKATEIGIDAILPLITERTYKKALNYQRLYTIAREASEQSGRLTVPVIHPIAHIHDIYSVLPKDCTVMYADTSMAGDTTGNSGGNMNTMCTSLENSSAVVCIGPEGGWSEAEIQWWHAEQAQQRAAAISLGENILKTETAAVVAAAYMCRPISL